MLDTILDGILDTLKLLPYLFITFIILEYIEHKITNKNMQILTNNQKYGPIIGGILGGFPQCGFSTMAANLFSSKVITTGTLIAVFLSTSDEMLPIMLSEKANFTTIIQIIGFKVLIGIIIGLIVDFIHKRNTTPKKAITDLCEHDHCHCEQNIFISCLKHTLKTAIFVLIANLIINIIIYYLGEETLSNILLNKNIFSYFIASLVGLIPNCASSIVLTELYLSNLITLGNLLAGLLTGSGLGILLLFKTNKNIKENITILSIIYLTGVIIGTVVDLII